MYLYLFLLHSNSTWIAEDRACLTYGFRGVVHCNLLVNLLSSVQILWLICGPVDLKCDARLTFRNWGWCNWRTYGWHVGPPFRPFWLQGTQIIGKGSNFWLPLLIARGIFKYLSFVSLYLLHSAIFDRLECQMTESDPKPRKRKSSISCFQRLHKNLLHFCVLNGENRLWRYTILKLADQGVRQTCDMFIFMIVLWFNNSIQTQLSFLAQSKPKYPYALCLIKI